MTTAQKKMLEVSAKDLFQKVVYRRSDGAEGGGQFNCYPDLDYETETVHNSDWWTQYDHEHRAMSDKACLKAAGLSTDEVCDSKNLDQAAKTIEETAARHNMKVTDAREFLQAVSDRHFSPENIRARESAEKNAPTKNDVGNVLFSRWESDSDGEPVWSQKEDDEILSDLGINLDDLRNEKHFEAAVSKIDQMARSKGCVEHNGREFLSGIIEREESQMKDTAAFFDAGEKRHVAADASNARLDARRASEAQSRQGSRLSI